MKGLVEKAPAIVRAPFVIRTLVPGAAGTALIYPLAGWKISLPEEAVSTRLADLWPLLGLTALAILLGGLVSTVFADAIYKVYEGYRLWPDWLRVKLTKRHSNIIARLLEIDKGADEHTSRKIWTKLRRYPLDDDGNPRALCPTMLGNILAEYEQYPRSRYGINVVFYWPRLWLQIDRERKLEIDSAWSIADGLLSLSAICFVGGVLWIVLSAFELIAFRVHYYSSVLDFVPSSLSPGAAAIGGVGLLAAGVVCYDLSLPFHRKNGEIFKSLFDIYRAKLTPVALLSADERTAWKAAWSYLQYLLIRCLTCGKHFSASLDRCDKCNTPAKVSLDSIRTLLPPTPAPPSHDEPTGTEQT